MVSATLPVFVVSATEVAVTVTVCADAVAAGAVYVAEVVVVFDRVPPPLTLHDTPSGVPLVLLSLLTVAVSVTVSVPSTVVTEAVTATEGDFELPPQPENDDTKAKMTASRNNRLQDIRTLQLITDPLANKEMKRTFSSERTPRELGKAS
jgi:hypothetical protein